MTRFGCALLVASAKVPRRFLGYRGRAMATPGVQQLRGVVRGFDALYGLELVDYNDTEVRARGSPCAPCPRDSSRPCAEVPEARRALAAKSASRHRLRVRLSRESAGARASARGVAGPQIRCRGREREGARRAWRSG